jgi:uncharacterized protein (TIGR00255 family)
MAKIASMTGFASHSGTAHGVGWAWELRSVNARGLELRFRLPPGMDRLESELRAAAASVLKRGTVAVSLRLSALETAGFVIDRPLLRLLAAEADALAAERPGTELPRIESLMALPGVIRRDASEAEQAPHDAAMAEIRAGFDLALAQMVQARLAEGERLATILAAQLAQLAASLSQAVPQAQAQAAAQALRLAETIQTLLADWPAPPAERMAQELALLASRSDVTEELDRLASHLVSATALLATGGPQGRPLDFLVQEFMREANTLCSKSASIELTAIGLQMKGTIEQIREQVQNIE